MAMLNLNQTALSARVRSLMGNPREEFNKQYQAAYDALRPPSRLPPSMERAVRPFLFIDSQPPVAPAQKELLPGEATEAFISWGKSSTFIRPPIDPLVSEPGDTIYNNFNTGGLNNDPRRNNRRPNEAQDIIMQEEARKTKNVTITDPDDSNVSITVARITEITFRNSENGRRYVFKINDWTG
jgi:hypothetical protein